jgi:hypothetical protein
VAQKVVNGEMAAALALLKHSYNNGWQQGYANGRVAEMSRKSVAKALVNWAFQFGNVN